MVCDVTTLAYMAKKSGL